MTLLSTISKWGNWQGIRLPKTLLELLQWVNNDKLEIDWGEPEGKEIW